VTSSGRDSILSLYQGQHGKGSDKWEFYLRTYEKLFASYRNEDVRLLEIGVQNGGSLEVWADYFASASKIVGCDINPKCGDLAFGAENISVVVGNVVSDEVVSQLVDIVEKYDIIIDDGSHRSSDIVRAFLNLFGHLSDGGIYVVEDLACSYWKEYEGGLFYHKSAISFFKLLVDYCNRDFWGIEVEPGEIFRSFGFDAARYSKVLDHVHSVEFLNSMCVIRKDTPENNQLGQRVVVGDSFEVEDIRSLNGSDLPVPSQIENPDACLPEGCASVIASCSLTSEARVYWGGENKGYVEARSRGMSYSIDGECRQLALDIVEGDGVSRLRLDPANVPCVIAMHSISLVDGDENVVWQWDGRFDSIKNSSGIFCWPVDEGVHLVCWNDDPELELALSDVTNGHLKDRICLMVEFTPYPLLEKLPRIFDEIAKKLTGGLVPSMTQSALPIGFSHYLSDLAGLLESKLEQKNGVIASKQHEVECMQEKQQALYEQVVRAEAQLDLLKEFVLPEGTGRIERL